MYLGRHNDLSCIAESNRTTLLKEKNFVSTILNSNSMKTESVNQIGHSTAGGKNFVSAISRHSISKRTSNNVKSAASLYMSSCAGEGK